MYTTHNNVQLYVHQQHVHDSFTIENNNVKLIHTIKKYGFSLKIKHLHNYHYSIASK